MISPDEPVDLEVILQPLEFIQLVVVDGGELKKPTKAASFFIRSPMSLFLSPFPAMPRAHKTTELTRWQLHLMTVPPNALHVLTTFPP